MIDTGMNRLGLDPQEVSAELLNGLDLHTLMSHLACADEDHPLNDRQRAAFRAIAGRVPARRYSLANSAGILLGGDYAFDLTRPGLALYGGIARPEAAGKIAQVVRPHAQVLQTRRVRAGESVGYGATYVAPDERRAAILNLGYADGYLRGFSGTGGVLHEGQRLPLIGRVSMDLIAVDVSEAPALVEGDWLEIDYDLSAASQQSGLSQYELLTGLSERLHRFWI